MIGEVFRPFRILKSKYLLLGVKGRFHLFYFSYYECQQNAFKKVQDNIKNFNIVCIHIMLNIIKKKVYITY